MKLTSNWSHGKLFWRTFNKDDTVYLIGLREGFLSNGESVNYEHPTGFFQMEVKKKDIKGSTLAAPGHVFNNTDEYIITDNGQLIEIQEAANVIIDTGFKLEFYGAVTQFLSAGSVDSTIKVVSSLTQVTTSNNTSQTTVTNEAINETNTQIGGKVTGNGEHEKIKIGIEVNGSVSNKITNKIASVIANNLGVQIATTSLYSEEQNITLKAEKLTAIITSWQRRFVTGKVTIGHDTFQYNATLGYHVSRQISEYKSPDQLPLELMAVYKEQNPGYLPPPTITDGSVMREKSSALVYVIFGGAKFHIPDPDVLQRLYGGWGSVVIIADNALDNVPTTPHDGTILREEHNDYVWLIESGKRRHITTPLVLDQYGGWGVVHVVPDGSTLGFAIGDPLV